MVDDAPDPRRARVKLKSSTVNPRQRRRWGILDHPRKVKKIDIKLQNSYLAIF